MFGYKRIKIGLTKEEIRELKEGRAAFFISKDKKAFFVEPEEVKPCLREALKVLLKKRTNEMNLFAPIELLERRGWLFVYSNTDYGYMKINDRFNKVKVYIRTKTTKDYAVSKAF